MDAPGYRLFETREVAIAQRVELAARYGFPTSARLVEWEVVPDTAHRARALVLWMENAYARVQSESSYSCPGTTQGSHYLGPTRVSLVDTERERILSTIQLRYGIDRARTILQQWDEPKQRIEQDFMVIPFGLPDRGLQTDLPVRFWYRAPGGTTDQPAEVQVLSLLDYNGDADSTEFGLFDTEACAGTSTAVIGYSKRRDSVVWYSVLLEGRRHAWVDSWLTHDPSAPGRWHYSNDYRARGGSVDVYDIRYDVTLEAFVGTRRSGAP